MSVSPRDPSRVVKTYLRKLIELAASGDLEFKPLMNTTINFKYRNLHNKLPTKLPVLKYFGIGIKGCYNADDANLVSPYDLEGGDMDLYQPIPFRMVPVDEDLSAAERADYRMRVRQTVRGQDYFCYYLKRLVAVDASPRIVRVDPQTKLEEPYELDSSNLNPTPRIPSTNGAVDATVPEIHVSTRFSLTYTAKEVYEAINVLFEGDLRYARISELGIYQGEDQLVTGYDANNAAFNYTEAIYTQLAFKQCNTGVAMTSPSAVSTQVLSLESGSLVTF